jgi:hypothetical protein
VEPANRCIALGWLRVDDAFALYSLAGFEPRKACLYFAEF